MTYKRLLKFRFAQLENMEEQIDGCHKMYSLESQELYAKAPPKRQIEFSKVEARLPLSFGILYVIVVLVVIVVAF
jgi:hypothetical protein